MTLPYDIARCSGTPNVLCGGCRRREPGRPDWQVYTPPEIDHAKGECINYISHIPVRYANSTNGD